MPSLVRLIGKQPNLSLLEFKNINNLQVGYLNKSLELLLGKSNVALNEAIEMLTHKAALSRGNDAIDRAMRH